MSGANNEISSGADWTARPKSLDWDGFVTEVLSLAGQNGVFSYAAEIIVMLGPSSIFA